MTDTRSSPGSLDLRQSLIEAICPHIKRWCDDGDGRPEPCKGCPAEVVTSEGVGIQMCRLNAQAAADDLLGIIDAAQGSQVPALVAVARMAKAAAELELGSAAAPDFSPQEMLDAANAVLSPVSSTPRVCPTCGTPDSINCSDSFHVDLSMAPADRVTP